MLLSTQQLFLVAYHLALHPRPSEAVSKPKV